MASRAGSHWRRLSHPRTASSSLARRAASSVCHAASSAAECGATSCSARAPVAGMASMASRHSSSALSHTGGCICRPCQRAGHRQRRREALMSIPGRGLSKTYARGRARIRELNAADAAARQPQPPVPCPTPASPSSASSARARSVPSAPWRTSLRAGSKPCPCGCGEMLRCGRIVCRALWSDLDPYWRAALTRSTNVIERRVAARHILSVAAELRQVRRAAAGGAL